MLAAIQKCHLSGFEEHQYQDGGFFFTFSKLYTSFHPVSRKVTLDPAFTSTPWTRLLIAGTSHAAKLYCYVCDAVVKELRGQDATTSSNKPTRGEAIVFAFVVIDVHLQLLEQKRPLQLETHPGTYATPPTAALVLHQAQCYDVFQVSCAFWSSLVSCFSAH